ncbi:MAG: mannose-1-phosphate guanylyltransferase/mannose-6-phosphate isomerase [Pseudomonadota bacterium]
MIRPIILAGGAGTRLWPLSRPDRPKQFVPLTGALSPYQETLRRVSDPNVFARPIIVTRTEYRFIAAAQAAEVSIDAEIALEPEGRDSALAVAVGAELAARAGDAAMLVLAADHVIDPADAFVAAVLAARPAAQEHLVTFGVQPSAPETGYGYIEAGPMIGPDGAARRVVRFIEKPGPAQAAEYVAAGYLWNSGNLMTSPPTLQAELKRHAAELLTAAAAAVDGSHLDLGFRRLAPAPYAGAPAISIDYALLEKSERTAVVPVSFRWSDIGTWEAIRRELSDGSDAGVTRGSCVSSGSPRSLAYAAPGMEVALVDAPDMMVVATTDAVLVADRRKAGAVRELHAAAAKARFKSATASRCVLRPWGSFESLAIADRYQVKRLLVRPGEKLSLQKHFHRAEHWIVVKGTGEVERDGETIIVRENEALYLPQGCVHRLSNPGKIDLELIEVQVGSYLGEDDIVRLDDPYNR